MHESASQVKKHQALGELSCSGAEPLGLCWKLQQFLSPESWQTLGMLQGGWMNAVMHYLAVSGVSGTHSYSASCFRSWNKVRFVN